MKLQASQADKQARNMILGDSEFKDFNLWVSTLLVTGQLSYIELQWICVWIRQRLHEDLKKEDQTVRDEAIFFGNRVMEICKLYEITPNDNMFEGNNRDLIKTAKIRKSIGFVLSQIDELLEASKSS